MTQERDLILAIAPQFSEQVVEVRLMYAENLRDELDSLRQFAAPIP
jgi:hypothetical protein